MFRRLTFILFLAGCLLVSGCSISGTVTLDEGGIENVMVNLSTAAGTIIATTTTNSDGEYVFDDLSAGAYTVSIDPPEGYTRSIRQSVVKENDYTRVENINFALASAAVRTTEAGDVIGFRENNGSHAWLGIPYAAPPVENLRWKAPLPADSWGNDTYIALEISDTCAQLGSMLVDVAAGHIGDPIGCEDCLYLNIWAPEFPADNIPTGINRLPVMVWIHGGSNTTGHGGGYHGQILAESHDLIVITINYRLGPFGWFAHPALESGNDLDDSGNYGTLDIIRALNWVRDNIENFGGDPGNVTIFGESAGGWNTLSMMISQEAAGLFHRVVSESGGMSTTEMSRARNYIEDGGHYHSAREVVNNLLIADGAANRDAAKTTQDGMSNEEIQEYLYGKSMDDILNACGSGDGESISVPTGLRDGVVLPTGDPLTRFEDTANYNEVPLIIGSNRDEIKLYTIFDPNFTIIRGGLPIRALDKTYYALYASYKSDAWKINGVDRLAQILSETPGQPGVYAYRFDWDEEPTILGINVGFLLGAAHGMEISFVFNNFDQFMVPQYVSLVFSEESLPGRQQLGASMSSYWAEFAYNGSPGFGRLNSNPLEWKKWDNRQGGEKTVIFDTETDGGIRMTNSIITLEGLKYRLLSETGFTTQTQHCDMYSDLFYTSDLWSDEEYETLGADGCGVYAQ